MNISDDGLDLLIKPYESWSSTPYKDLRGFLTVGYGHKLLPGESFSNGLTPDEGLELLKTDLLPVETTINALVKVDLNQNQFDALCSFTYNVGCGAFRKSHLLIYLNEGNYDLAAQQFTKWNHAGGVEVFGLLRRRQAERDLFLKPVT